MCVLRPCIFTLLPFWAQGCFWCWTNSSHHTQPFNTKKTHYPADPQGVAVGRGDCWSTAISRVAVGLPRLLN